MAAYTKNTKAIAGAWNAVAILPADSNNGTVEVLLLNSGTIENKVSVAISTAATPSNDDRIYIDKTIKVNETLKLDLLVLQHNEKLFIRPSASGILARVQGYYEEVILGT